MEIVIADFYRKSANRLSKDTNGGYGTEYKVSGSPLGKLMSYFVKNQISTPETNLTYLMSGLELLGHTTTYIKCFDNSFKSISHPDLILVPSSIICWETEVAGATALKEKFPNSKVLMYGPFAVVKNADIPEGINLLKGEIEQILLNFELINKCNNEKIIDVGFVDDLDALPFPSPKFATNVKSRVAFLPGLVMPILAKRGCPYSCSYYCTYPLQQGKKIRKHSVRYIVDLIKHCKSNNIHSFIFRDPVFTIDKNWVREFCHEICHQKIKIRFGAEFHLKDLDDDLIVLLARAGLRICYVGIESQSESNLKDVKRQSVDHDTQKSNIQKLEKAGVICKAMFILGLPEDTPESINKTIDYAKYIDSSLAQFSVFTPYPGTPAYKDFDVDFSKFENFTQWDLIYRARLSTQEIQHFLKEANTKFYRRPTKILRLLRKLVLTS